MRPAPHAHARARPGPRTHARQSADAAAAAPAWGDCAEPMASLAASARLNGPPAGSPAPARPWSRLGD